MTSRFTIALALGFVVATAESPAVAQVWHPTSGPNPDFAGNGSYFLRAISYRHPQRAPHSGVGTVRRDELYDYSPPQNAYVGWDDGADSDTAAALDE